MKILFLQSESENLSVELLSSYLKKHHHEIHLFFDPKVFYSSVLSIGNLSRYLQLKDVLIDKIAQIKPDMIAFSVMTDDYQWALSQAALIKEHFNIPIIFGGHHVMSVPERVIAKECVDIICIGEGEDSLLELANSFDKGQIDYYIPNLWFKKDGHIVKNALRDLETNLDKYPFPDKQLFYNEVPSFKKVYTAMFSRGCCYKCTYCCNNVRMKKYKGKGKYLRIRSVENAIHELQKADQKYNPNIYCFADDMITAYKTWFYEFSLLYKKHINKPYVCYTHPKFFNEKIAKTMKESNCLWLNFGLQTASEPLRRKVLRRIESNQEMKKSAEICHKYNLQFSIDHIFNLPFETKDDYIESMNFYTEIQPTIINTFYLAYYPETDIISSGVESGALQPEDVDKIEEGLHKSSFTLSIDSGKGFESDVKAFNHYFLIFTLIPILPKKIMMKLIDKEYYLYLKKIPSFVTLMLKVLLRIKIKQFYLYRGEVERLFSNIMRNIKLRRRLKLMKRA